MKIRAGFVSNSSSSSFIIKSNITTSDVALMMLNVIMDERKDWYEPEELEEKFGEAVEWLIENPDYDEPIMFPWSINEETYIWRVQEGIYVDTCNNHRWYNYFDFDYTDEYYDYRDTTVFLDLSDNHRLTKGEYRKQRYGV